MYISKEISVYDNIEELSTITGEQTKDFLLLVVCTEGRMMIELNDATYRLAKADMLLCPPNWEIDSFMRSADFKGNIYLIKKHALDGLTRDIIHVDNNIWEQYRYLKTHPIVHLEQRQLKLKQAFEEIRKFYTNQTDNPYRDHIMNVLLQVAVYEMLNWLNGKISTDNKLAESTSRQCSRKEQLTGDFMRLVMEQKGVQRQVKWYADKLCVSPKYLAACVQHVTNKAPHEFINEMVIAEIKQRLKQTNDTAQQISIQLDFPSQSLFGKFVKQKTGMSPLQLRRALRK